MGKLVRDITSIDQDFARWYTDIVVKAELIDYSEVRGCTVLRPYGYAIWENISRILDDEFKKLGVQNVSMPLLIPERLLQKEKNHIDGFAPEVAWVTMGGKEHLTERLCIRPTSEVLFCSHFQRVVHSWRDLPMIYNQWCSVVRWEKTSRPFLRSVEFHWQEGHTLHSSADEAKALTLKMLNVYSDFFVKKLCIPVILGQKTESEKFAGAEITYTVECMMKDGKALQSATSHYFGSGFANAFDIKFSNKNNEEETPYQTSWGLSTRVIAAIIMSHGDDDGLILPPAIAPLQVIIVPIDFSKDKEVLDKSRGILNLLKHDFKCKIDDSDDSIGSKFATYDMKGVPIRIEVGPRDILSNSCVVVRRDTHEKINCSIDNIKETVSQTIKKLEKNIYNICLENRNKKTVNALSRKEFENHTGFIKMSFCNTAECEQKIKEQYGFTARCIPFDDKNLISENCPICGKKSSVNVYFAKSY